jgi:hypothetical protein
VSEKCPTRYGGGGFVGIAKIETFTNDALLVHLYLAKAAKVDSGDGCTWFRKQKQAERVG